MFEIKTIRESGGQRYWLVGAAHRRPQLLAFHRRGLRKALRRAFPPGHGQHHCQEFGALYGYTESDEISLLFAPDWSAFDREVEKLVSLSAGLAAPIRHAGGPLQDPKL